MANNKNIFANFGGFIKTLIFMLAVFCFFNTVNQADAANINLISNPSVEIICATNPSIPDMWYPEKNGNNASLLIYPVTGMNNGKGLQIQMRQRVDGWAGWFFNQTAIKQNTQYVFSDYYKSNVKSIVRAKFILNTGRYQTVGLGNPSASINWKKAEYIFTPPAGAISVSIYHLLNINGDLVTDEYYLGEKNILPEPAIITVSAPLNNAQVSGLFDISASVNNATNTSVQFLMDNANIGSVDLTAPFSINYDSALKTNGVYNIIARLYYGTGQSIVSAPISVNINNIPPPPPTPSDNLILNPSFEEMDAYGKPKNWSNSIWLSNNAQFVYPVDGYDGARAAKIVVTSYTSGDAKWYFDDVAVKAGLTYEFSDYYMSDVSSNITFRFLNNDNTYSYKGIEDLAPSATWKKYTTNITIPANAKSLTLFHIIEAVGNLAVDNYYLKVSSSTPPMPDPLYFAEGMTTLSFDDARMSQYSVAFPYMQTAGIKGTFYPHLIDMTNLGTNSFYHPVQMLEMQAAGNEFGSHTRTHAHLTALSTADMISEIAGSRSDLLAMGATPVNSFCYPYGEYNPTVMQSVKDAGYTNARSVIYGYNLRSTDKFQLFIQAVGKSATLDQIKSWIDKSKTDKTWLILMFHQIDYSGNNSGTTPEIFRGIVDYLKLTNTKVVTVGEGVGMMN